MLDPMGRRRTRDHDLPPGLVLKRGRYYYGRNQEAFGADYAIALIKWAERRGESHSERPTFATACSRYVQDALPKLARKTQQNYGYHMAVLLKVFGRVYLDEIQTADVHDFLKARPKHSGTHEKAVLSLIFNFARVNRITNAPNPCAGVRGHKSERDIYVTDEQLAAVYGVAPRVLRDYLDLAYLTGQRPSDVLRMTRQDIKDGRLWVRQAKTGSKVRLAIVGPLEAVLKRLQAQSYPVQEMYLVLNDKGRGMKLGAMQERFRQAAKAAGVAFQMRDLRAKAITDIPDIREAQKTAGHSLETTTSGYRRDRAGELAQPVMRGIADIIAAIADKR